MLRGVRMVLREKKIGLTLGEVQSKTKKNFERFLLVLIWLCESMDNDFIRSIMRYLQLSSERLPKLWTVRISD